MTRRERQTQFWEALQEWLQANVGTLTVAEVVGIMQVHIITMTADCHFCIEDDDDDAEDWKEGGR